MKKDFKFDLQTFAAPDAKDLDIGAGSYYFNRWDSESNPTKLRHLGNVEASTITNDITEVTKKQSMTASKSIYARATTEQKVTNALTLSEFNPYNVALALYGEEGVVTQVAKTVTDEAYTVSPGDFVQLPYYNCTGISIAPFNATAASIAQPTKYAVSGSGSTGTIASSGTYTGTTSGSYFVTITAANTASGVIAGMEFTYKKGIAGTSSTATTATGSAQTLAEGVQVTFTVANGQDFVVGDIFEIKVVSGAYIKDTDYTANKVDLRGGIIRIPEKSTIPENTKVKISYTVPAAEYPKVSAGKTTNIEGYLFFVGDPTYGKPKVIDFWHVSLKPNGDIGLISDDFSNFKIDCTVLDDSTNHPDDPLYKITYVNK
ncbi:MAG: hypothetical protein H6Q70_517 [Firmicutes bacterium]|nr:hypothetical protein [Bacillota bacterium]